MVQNGWSRSYIPPITTHSARPRDTARTPATGLLAGSTSYGFHIGFLHLYWVAVACVSLKAPRTTSFMTLPSKDTHAHRKFLYRLAQT